MQPFRLINPGYMAERQISGMLFDLVRPPNKGAFAGPFIIEHARGRYLVYGE